VCKEIEHDPSTGRSGAACSTELDLDRSQVDPMRSGFFFAIQEPERRAGHPALRPTRGALCRLWLSKEFFFEAVTGLTARQARSWEVILQQ
jgi:hypothetical protein